MFQDISTKTLGLHPRKTVLCLKLGGMSCELEEYIGKQRRWLDGGLDSEISVGSKISVGAIWYFAIRICSFSWLGQKNNSLSIRDLHRWSKLLLYRDNLCSLDGIEKLVVIKKRPELLSIINVKYFPRVSSQNLSSRATLRFYLMQQPHLTV